MGILGILGGMGPFFLGFRRCAPGQSCSFWDSVAALRDNPVLSGIPSLRAGAIPFFLGFRLCAPGQSRSFWDSVAALRHPAPPAAGRCKREAEESSSELDFLLPLFCGKNGIRTREPL